MKKKIFSLKLYVEGLKQTKLISIIFFVILAVQAIAIPLGIVIENISYEFSGTQGIEFITLNPLLYLMIYVISPLLVLSLFSFLNKRNASDFYHSISDTRISLFLSFFAAICTHIIALSVLSTCIGILVNLIFPQYFVLNFINIFRNLFGILTSSLFSAAVTVFAMTLTGTLVTNIAVTGLILILPDYIISMIKMIVISQVPIARSSGNFSKYLPIGFNFFSADGEYPLDSINGSIYTIVLAAVIACIALLIFRRRKSESAGYPALNRYTQAAVRIMFCMVVCIFACGGIFNHIATDYTFDGVDVFFVVIIYVVALIVYFLYELITTRKFSSLVKTLPALLIVVVLNVVCVLGMNLIYNSYLRYEPNADDIEYVRFAGDMDDNIYDIQGYLENKCSKIKIKDKEIKSMIAAILSDNIDRIEKGSFYNYDYNEEWFQYNLIIASGGIEHPRNLRITQEQFNTIIEFLRNDDDYQKLYTSLPDSNKVSAHFNFYNRTISNKDAKRVYNIYRNEVSKLGFVDWYKSLNYYNDAVDSTTISGFQLTVIDGTEIYEIYVPILMMFDETVSEFLKLSYDEDSDENIKNCLADVKEHNLYYIDMYLYNTEYAVNSYFYDTDILPFSEEFAELAKCLEPCNEYDPDDIVIQINLENEIETDSTDRAITSDEYSSFFVFNGDIQEFEKIFTRY